MEDDHATFRFHYTAEFLEWWVPSPFGIRYVYEFILFRFDRALKHHGYYKEWLIGVRVKSNKKLIGFISGVPITIRVRGK